jgi:hypothetical protein
VDQLGPNALGETLEPGRVGDCYLGLLLPPRPAGEPEAGSAVVVAPAALLHPRIPQPADSLVYELLTGHPEREAGELVFVADLPVSYAPRPPTPGPRSASTPTTSPRRSSAAGRPVRSLGCRSTISASRRPARSPGRR